MTDFPTLDEIVADPPSPRARAQLALLQAEMAHDILRAGSDRPHRAVPFLEDVIEHLTALYDFLRQTRGFAVKHAEVGDARMERLLRAAESALSHIDDKTRRDELREVIYQTRQSEELAPGWTVADEMREKNRDQAGW